MEKKAVKVSRIVGPVAEIEEIGDLRMLDMVEVGDDRLIGEVMHLKGDRAYVQIYEDTTSIKAGDPVYTRGTPLTVELGPGMLGTIYDGIQRPLEVIKGKEGSFIRRGVHVPAIDRSRKWHFQPKVKAGGQAGKGAVLGEVRESELIAHRVMVPPDIEGTVTWIAPEGDYTIEEKIAVVQTAKGERDLSMLQKWPVRMGRPVGMRETLSAPLITGQRVIDTLFPVAKGGAVAIPGGFGTGKTVTQHQLAKWSDAEIVVYVGCGERGNEMTDVLETFPKLVDPRTGRPLMERTILIANTSNMPVAAREASIYTGITMAEYYRDMGYNVALMADSTSRWAEALRELSGRLEEMPLEEGFPAYLPSRLAEFYERAGKVKTLSGMDGSITIVASVSPPGGDFSEPVTSHTKRFVRCFWALDRDLAYSRHYPAISWTDSYSEYLDQIKEWWEKNIDPEWTSYRLTIMEILQHEQRLQQVVKLVGADVLPVTQRLILETSYIFRNGFLQQVAYDKVDTYASPKKQFYMLKAIIKFYHKSEELIRKGLSISELRQTPVFQDLLRMKFQYTESPEDLEKLRQFADKGVEESLNKLINF
ncbi:MAG: V-type ATP synthase subunit A [Deltaproteobacteria bacterium]